MKKVAILVLICFLPSTSFAGNLPYIPAVASPLSATLNTINDAPNFLLQSRFSVSPSNFRGNFGENLMKSYFTSGADLSSSKTWYSLDPGAIMVKHGGAMALLDPSKTGRAGFDGLFMQFNSKGNPTGVMISESKFAGSFLGQTKYFGKQMSDEWVRSRAAKTALHYKRLSRLIDAGRIQHSNIFPVTAKISGKITQIPISNKESVFLWWDKNSGSYVYYSDKVISNTKLLQATDKIARMMDGVAEGNITPRKVLWHVDAKNGSILVTRENLDANGDVIRGSGEVINSLSKPYAKLSSQNQALVDESVIDAISKQKYKYLPEDLAREQARFDWEIAKKHGKAEQFISEYNPDQTKFAWRTATNTALKAGFIGGIFALVFSAASQAYDSKFDYKAILKDVVLGFLSSGMGTFVGTGASYLLSNSQSLLSQMIPQKFSRLVGGSVSGLIATAIFSYGYALWNGRSFRDANRMMITGVAATVTGTIASYAILQTAMLVGTASTGTAISTLSGAVATKAAMAWLGGGAVSAGGFGMTGGAIVLSGGTLVFVVAVTAAISYGWSLLDESNRIEHLKSLIEAYPM